MTEMLKKIQEMELKADKYDKLKEIYDTKLKKIFELTQSIQKEINDINPSFESPIIRWRYGQKNTIIQELYQQLKEDDNLQLSGQDIADKYNVSYSTANVISKELRKMEGITTRKEGIIIYIYYFKPKITKDETEISDGVKIPTKFTFKS